MFSPSTLDVRDSDLIVGAEGVDEDEVPKACVAIQSKDWISAGTEVGPLLTDDVAGQPDQSQSSFSV